MKLISKTMFYFVLISIPLLIIAASVSFYLMKMELKDASDEALQSEMYHAQKLLNAKGWKNMPIYLSADSLSFIAENTGNNRANGFQDLQVFDPIEEELVNYRVLHETIDFNGRSLEIQVAKMTLEEEELTEGILSTLFLFFVFIALAIVVSQWMVTKWVWQPFHQTIQKLHSFDVKKSNWEALESTSISEFDQLNASLNSLMTKVSRDFQAQREFTENAAHEVQTPIAVIKSNVNLLMQSPLLSEEELTRLAAIENTLQRMSRMNKSLLLLAKIDNGMFPTEQVDVSMVLQDIIALHKERMEGRDIELILETQSGVKVQWNKSLAEILFSNLLQNAIRHNYEGGRIFVRLTPRSLAIANTGKKESLDTSAIFKRFNKDSQDIHSMGLGLAIVKSIADMYHLELAYTFEKELHEFEVFFV